jgi:hypothetical protein
MEKTLTVLSVAALGFACAIRAGAQEKGMPFHAMVGTAPAPSVETAHPLVATFIDQGDANEILAKGNEVYYFGNLASLTCTANCTVEVDAMVQVGNNTTANNLWDVCEIVDNGQEGTNTLPCPYQGTLPTNSSYEVGNYVWSVSLPEGLEFADEVTMGKSLENRREM